MEPEVSVIPCLLSHQVFSGRINNLFTSRLFPGLNSFLHSFFGKSALNNDDGLHVFHLYKVVDLNQNFKAFLFFALLISTIESNSVNYQVALTLKIAPETQPSASDEHAAKKVMLSVCGKPSYSTYSLPYSTV
jgi:hypothetical protein